MNFAYRIRLESGESLSGESELRGGANRIARRVPEGKLASVEGRLRLETAESEKIFMNGYQTWTYCPERGKKDALRPRARLPKSVVDYFGIDRYGDYHFVDYPNRPGVTHGESYCYFRLGERYRLFASLDEDMGYTLFRYDANSAELRIERDCAGVRCGGELRAFDLFYAEGTEDEVFDAWFAALGVRPRTTEKLAGYSSWYNRYQNIDDESITGDLEGCAQVMRAGDLFQIDDGWEPAVGDWLEADAKKFPRGMRASVEDIHAKGFKAGLWLAPFICQKSSEVYKNHPDWLLMHDGKPWYCGCNWGGFYSLDVDKPEVREYIESCFRRVFDDWGFDLVKLDFLYGGAPFGTETESRAKKMRRCVELLRRCCGDKLILGCGVPLMPCFGLVDYCRISCDVSLDWDNTFYMRLVNRERVSTRQAIGSTVFRRQLNGRAFISDPDVFFLRDYNLKLTPEQKYTLATVNSVLGGLLLCSDDMSSYDESARAQYAQLLKNREATDVRVENDGDGLYLSYRIDGAEQRLRIE